MKNLESLQLSSLLSTYDQGHGKLTVQNEGFFWLTKVCEETSHVTERYFLSWQVPMSLDPIFSLEKCLR